jgi:hypothetical protein
MVFLKTDAGEYKELSNWIPGTLNIGRGDTNDIRPESQSVSKTHATLMFVPVNGGNKIDVYLEDVGSRNVSARAFLYTNGCKYINCLSILNILLFFDREPILDHLQ